MDGLAGMLVGLVVLVLSLAMYIFVCFCLKLICEKAGKDPGILIWIPILNMIPLFEAAGLNPLWIIGLFVPFLNIVVAILLWIKVAQARGKSPLWGILMIIPVANIVALLFLAFSD